MTCRHRAGMIALSTGVKPPDLTVTLSPANTSQASPGAQVVTASATGGEGSISYSFDAKFADGTNANSTLSGSGSSRTVTTTAYSQTVVVTVTATDSGTPTAQTATARAVVATVVPADLVASMSPATTSQATPGAVVLTASSTGGVGTVSWAWSAKFADGTNASSTLSGSGASRTVTTTSYSQTVLVVAVGTDASGQVSPASAVVSAPRPTGPTITAPSVARSYAAGAQTVTFPSATGTSLSYSATLSAPDGSAATLSGSGLGPYSFTTDLEGAYVVTLTATDPAGQTAVAAGVHTLVAPGVLWTPLLDEDFTTYDAVSRSGGGSLALTKGGVTQYTATLSVSAGTWQAGVAASGLFIRQTAGTGQGAFTITPAYDSTKWLIIQWLIPIPTLATTSDRVGATANSSSVAAGTELFVCNILKNATSGFDLKISERLGGVAQGPATVVSGSALSGYLCVTLTLRGKLAQMCIHDSDTLIEPQDLNTGQLASGFYELSSGDTQPNQFAQWFTPRIGLQAGNTVVEGYLARLRVFQSTPRMD